jgi:muramoyltetrapeptide carboxypeptidase
MLRPAPLHDGSLVRVVAPSSPFDTARFDRGLALLQARYRVHLSDTLFERSGYLAGNDDVRLQSLLAALADPQTQAIVAARGGFGAARLLPQLDPDDVRRANKWLVGFSDVTALHALWARAGVCSIHGPMVCSLWEARPEIQAQWFGLLGGQPPQPLSGLSAVHPGRAAGRLFAANLTVLAALAGTPYMPDLAGHVLVLEDVTERPYRLDRALTTLLQADALAGVRGFVLGQFSQCEPGPDGVTAEQMFEQRLAGLGVPVVGDAPIGHVPDNVPLLLGAPVEIDAATGTLAWTL